jgi:hypothetical protein
VVVICFQPRRRLVKRAASLALYAVAVLTAAGFFAGTAEADGLPVLGIDVGATGVASAAGGSRYVTLPAGRGTVVARVNPDGGRVLAWRLIEGAFTVPAVAYDGSSGGLSADGRTLVLIAPRASFPRARTAFTVLAATGLRPLGVVRLRGDFSYDAISPDGTWLYLIEYTSPTDPSRYLVRAYDLHTRRLLAAPVTDPREQTDKMRGSPLTRATSPDGRWAYTLYDGAGTTPFVHALDTTRRTARCIDLDALAGSDLSRVRLLISRGGRTLTVRNARQPVVAVDTRTFELSTPPSEAAPTPDGDRRRSPFPWPLIVLTAIPALLALTVIISIGVRRRQRAAVAH